MSKILLVADIHISDYTTRCPSNRFRLYQGSRTVAQNIVEVGKKEGCDYIAILGDLSEKSIVRPYVQAEIKLFLDTVMANFKEGWIIYGNHDLDSKAVEQKISDAFLGVMLPSNLHYADKTIINLEGNSIGLCNWSPKFDLSWIDSPVDILLSHATINYDENNTAYQSQELDESKFSIAFLGDIHRRAQIGKYVSIGVPQRCKLGDSEESSGIVLDLSTKNWGWVNLNPHDNLLKFVLTDNLDEEGYKEDINTWVVYKPDNVAFGSGQDIKIDTWSEIENLIEEAVVKSGLQPIHTEVLKNINNIDESEVDFSFELHKLHCENWRSITDATIEFKKGDKIYLSGSNGSGKSSLLSALSYAFMDVSTTQGLVSLKPFVQYGKSYCLTEVEFSFQGIEYRLRRGTKEYGLWINNEEQKYNNKRAFEEDVRNRFKFTQYLFDCLLYNSEHHRFVGGISPERKTEIMSKFLKLDRIDVLHNTSQIMLDNTKKERSTWAAKISETEKLLGYIQEKLNLINLPELSRQQLEDLKLEGLEIQRKNRLWTEYQTKSANLQGKLQTYKTTLDGLNEKQQSFRNPTIIDNEINSINQEIQNLHGRLVDLGNIRVNLEYKTREWNNLREIGNNAYLEAKGLSLGRKCSSCGQIIQNTAEMENHKQELMRKVEELKPQVEAIWKEIQDLTYLRDNSNQEYNQINQEIQRLNTEVSKRMTEKSIINSTQRDIQTYDQLLEKTQNELNSLGVVERVDLPSDFMEKMSSIESGINSWIQYESSKGDLDLKTLELNNLTSEIQKIDQYLVALDAYNKLTGPIGIIYEAIINKLKDTFSDNNVTYTVVRVGKGNKEHLSLVPMFKKGNDEIEYFSCSSGEKTLLDIHLLDKLITSAGILVLDETLKNLDPERLELVLEIIKNMNVNTLILTSHSEGISNFYNRIINLSINDKGLTEIC